MKITVLAENVSHREDCAAEHGLSLYIETERRTILFDMGQTDLFVRNAAILGCDLAKVDTAILSHGHYDHGGGLAAFLELNTHASILVSRHAFGDFYHGEDRYIGLDKSLRKNHRLRPVADKLILDEAHSLHSCNLLPRSFDMGISELTERVKDTFSPDRYLHEQYLLVKENGKRILISGCSHKGVLNLMSWLSPDVFIGGFHFSSIPEGDKLKKAARLLGKYDTEYYTCHCTGVPQYEFMRNYMDRLHYISVGTVFTV